MRERPRDLPKMLQPGVLWGGLKLQRVIPADPPSLIPIPLVPLWHPGAAWLIGLIGLVGMRWAKRIRASNKVDPGFFS
jgi:hypothetical protein